MAKNITLWPPILAIFAVSLSVQGAFIIEPVSTGKAFANYFYVGGTAGISSADSTAVGLTPGNGSIFGGDNATSDTYVFRYNLGIDTDNTVFAPGMNLGNGDSATGLTGGSSGVYNVYVTWPTSTGISGGGSDFSLINTLTPDAPLLVMNDVIQNSGEVGAAPGADAWFLLGSANLIAGQTYELHVTANNATFVSQRMDGVMFEVVPEPSTVALGLIGGVGLMVGYFRRRAKK